MRRTLATGCAWAASRARVKVARGASQASLMRVLPSSRRLERPAALGESCALTLSRLRLRRQMGSSRLEGERFQRKPALAPSVQPTGQRPDPGNASGREQPRHPGAGRLVGAAAVTDDVAVPRELDPALLEVLDGEPDGTRERVRLESHVDGATEIDNERLVAGSELTSEFVGRDPGDAQAAKEAPALDELAHDVPDNDHGQRHRYHQAELTGPGNDP